MPSQRDKAVLAVNDVCGVVVRVAEGNLRKIKHRFINLITGIYGKVL